MPSPAPTHLECWRRTYHPNQTERVEASPQEARQAFSRGARPVLDQEILGEEALTRRLGAIREGTHTSGAIESYARQVTDALHIPHYYQRTLANITRLFKSNRIRDVEIIRLVNQLSHNEMTDFYQGIQNLFGGQQMFYYQHTPAQGVLMCFPDRRR